MKVLEEIKRCQEREKTLRQSLDSLSEDALIYLHIPCADEDADAEVSIWKPGDIPLHIRFKIIDNKVNTVKFTGSEQPYILKEIQEIEVKVNEWLNQEIY